MFSPGLKLLIKNSSKLFIADIWTAVIVLIQAIIVARILGSEKYGLLALITVYVTIVNQIVDFRIRETAVKYTSEFLVKNDKERLWATLKLCYLIDLSTGFIAFLIVIFTARLASIFIIHYPEVDNLIMLYAVTLLFSTVNGTCLGILTVFDKFSWLSVYSIVSAVIRFILVTSFLLGGYGVRGVLIGYVIASFLSSAILFYLSFKAIKDLVWYRGINAKISLLRDKWREITKFLLNTNFNEFLTLFTKNIDILILGYFRAPLEVGYYRLAKNLVSALNLIGNPISTAIYPQLSKMWSGNKITELKTFIKRVTIFMSSITLPTALAVFIFIPWIIKYTVGGEFIPATLSVRIILWGILVSIIFSWTRPVLLSMGRPGILTSANAFNAITMFIFSLMLVPKLGYIGSSLMYVYPYLAGHIISIFAFILILKPRLR